MARELNHEEERLRQLQINEAVGHVLRSSPFHNSNQCKDLLKYLVEQSLRGNGGELKERIIGIEVFGRKQDYDTTEDAVVRGRVAEVRKRLAQYYQDEGKDSEVRIVIPSGSYRPTFISHPYTDVRSNGSPVESQTNPDLSHGAKGHPEPETAAISGLKVPREPRRRGWVIAAAAACALLLAAWIGIPRWTKSELDLFWQPILESKKTVLIYTGTLSVYMPSSSYAERTVPPVPPADQKLPATDWTFPPLVTGQVLGANDFVIDRISATGTGDAWASANLTALLAAHHRSFSLRSGPNLPFADLQGSPTVMIGAVSNFWAMDMTKDLPFFFDRLLRIRERGGQGRVWSNKLDENDKITDDYAIVSRLYDSKTGSPAISVAGITTCGTQAAGEFATDPAQLKKLASIPRDALERKNLQIVLHATLVNCNPTSIDIVAKQYW